MPAGLEAPSIQELISSSRGGRVTLLLCRAPGCVCAFRTTEEGSTALFGKECLRKLATDWTSLLQPRLSHTLADK